ncbi:hypothetical protein [Stenotrophomonas sp. VV52]|uniref:hypothetical protein n=1 Tax=Stenotrophomonas sp. VV52 TaxID=2066958 RepID=UPI0011AF13D4|nr:hypothetical protein [Stenotrophomonas sp. VV52]
MGWLAVLATSACGGFPGVSLDLEALGSEPLGQKLRPIWMNSPQFVESDLRGWLEAQPNHSACLTSVDCLQKLGFHRCAPANDGVHCSYHTVMTGTLFKPNDVRVPMRYELWIALDTHNGAIAALSFKRDLH